MNSHHWNRLFIIRFLLIVILASQNCLAEQSLIAQRVETLPVIDGRSDDRAWNKAPAVVTRDAVAEIDIELRAVYTDKQVALLVRYPDTDESRQHKTMIWDSTVGVYTTGPAREDTLVVKWNMEKNPVDLSISGTSPYKADIWFWKACRTDHAGFADDKYQIYSDVPLPKSKRVLSKNGRIFYLSRKGDSGEAAYRAELHSEYVADQTPRFKMVTPAGSRADVQAQGHWQEGFWTIEFLRNLDTSQSDDVELHTNQKYLFGVSRYEIAGRARDETLSQPDYGRGDINELLYLHFSP